MRAALLMLTPNLSSLMKPLLPHVWIVCGCEASLERRPPVFLCLIQEMHVENTESSSMPDMAAVNLLHGDLVLVGNGISLALRIPVQGLFLKFVVLQSECK
ncbi:hypothetical protein D5086_004028 [Populus alba]|uniref:Uncharacterized protein n=1 Tax=Populus alba TaxID=43335 RepID=A0ACC4CP81_POPAL